MYTSVRDYTSRNKMYEEIVGNINSSLSSREVKNIPVVPQMPNKNSNQKKNFNSDIDHEFKTRSRQTTSSYYNDLLPLIRLKTDKDVSVYFRPSKLDTRDTSQDARSYDTVNTKNMLSVENRIPRQMDYGNIDVKELSGKVVNKNNLKSINLMRTAQAQVESSPIIGIVQNRSKIISKK